MARCAEEDVAFGGLLLGHGLGRKNTRKLVGCILGLSDSELGFRSYTIHGFSSSNILRRRPWDTSFKEVVVRGEF